MRAAQAKFIDTRSSAHVVARPELLLPHATALYEHGACVIPLKYRERAAAVKWTKYQHVRPPVAEVDHWFRDTDSAQLGLAVILGEVSGGLLCRDFDERPAYDAWKLTQPRLAKSLPTVITARGVHIYARCANYRGNTAGGFIEIFGKNKSGRLLHGPGELRGDLHISVLPPSHHEKTGQPYSWAIKLKKGFPLIDIRELGYAPNPGTVTQDVSGLHLSGLPKPVLSAILASLPKGNGTRNTLIFEFCRRLYSIPEYRGRDPKDLHDFAEAWHREALPYIGTKSLKATLRDFDRGFPQVRHSLGEGGLRLAIESAKEKSLPDLPMSFRQADMYLLAAICRELQIQRGKLPFYLSTRNVAEIFGFLGAQPQVRAHRWLMKLVHENILKIATRGEPIPGGSASEYRYLLRLD